MYTYGYISLCKVAKGTTYLSSSEIDSNEKQVNLSDALFVNSLSFQAKFEQLCGLCRYTVRMFEGNVDVRIILGKKGVALNLISCSL